MGLWGEGIAQRWISSDTWLGVGACYVLGVAGGAVEGGVRGLGNMIVGTGEHLAETGLVIVDGIGMSQELVTGYRYDPVSSWGKESDATSTWQEATNKSVDYAVNGGLNIVTLGLYDLASAVYDYTHDGDEEALSKRAGPVAFWTALGGVGGRGRTSPGQAINVTSRTKASPPKPKCESACEKGPT